MQFVVAILGFILVVWVVTIAVWLIQWAVAAIVWVFQAVLLPIFMFLLPAIICLVILAGLYWGGWIAARNYFSSVKKNVNPKGALHAWVRHSVVGSQTFALSVLCAGSAAISGILVYGLSMAAVEQVQEYYAAIKFPHYEILYPFWEHF